MQPEEPVAESPLARFRTHLQRGELAYQVDRSSGKAVFYPRLIAPGSGSDTLDWRVSAGLGRVYAVTVISPRAEPAYNVVLVDMDEGYRLMSTVVDVPADDVRIGMRVRASIRPPADGAPPCPVFVVQEEPA